MVVYFQAARLYAGGVLTTVAPDTVVAQTMAAVAIEALVAAVDADGDYYVTTTDALYANGTKYELLVSSTVAATAVARTHPFRHVTPTTGDVTPPGAPTLGTPSAGETTVTVNVTPPADGDYSVTTIYLIPVLGGTILTGSGTSGLVTVSGAVPGTLYAVLGLAQDAAGNLSTPSNVGLSTTLPATDIDMPAYLKWEVNDEGAFHEHGPEAFDPSVTGDRRFHDLGRGRTWGFVIECHEPVFFGVRGIGGVMTVPRGQPGGLRDDTGR